MLITQQLVNGQLSITTIAKYSIAANNSKQSKFNPCFDAYGQLVTMGSEITQKVDFYFDSYGQFIYN